MPNYPSNLPPKSGCPDYKSSRQITPSTYSEIRELCSTGSTADPSPEAIADVNGAIAEMRARKLEFRKNQPLLAINKHPSAWSPSDRIHATFNTMGLGKRRRFAGDDE